MNWASLYLCFEISASSSCADARGRSDRRPSTREFDRANHERNARAAAAAAATKSLILAMTWISVMIFSYQRHVRSLYNGSFLFDRSACVVCFCFDSREIFRLDLPAASVIWVFRNGEFSSSGLERRTLKKYRKFVGFISDSSWTRLHNRGI